MNCCYHKKSLKYEPKQIAVEAVLSVEPTLSTEQFLEEGLKCGTCKEVFTLKEDQLSGYCGGCEQFLHCGIAGSCIGPNCTIINNKQVYRVTWCIACIPKTVIINLEDLGPGKHCLCQECLDDDRTAKAYKRKI